MEIIKYALGEQIGALATLRGKLYELNEAEQLSRGRGPGQTAPDRYRLRTMHHPRLQYHLRHVSNELCRIAS